MAPYNSQCKTIKTKFVVCAITLNRLFGEGITGTQTKAPFDISGYKCIVFDEIMLHDHERLVKI